MLNALATRWIAAVLLLAAVGVPSSSSAADKVKVRAAYIPAVTWLPAWVAQSKGFFAEEGLDVSMISVQNISLLPSTLGKQLDIAPATVIDLIKAAAGGLNVVAVAGGHVDAEGHISNAIIVGKDSGIKGVKDLAGKTVATPTIGAILHVALLHWLKQEGVDPNSIRAVEVPFPNMPDQLKAGRVDAAEAVNPFMMRMLAEGDISLGDQLLKIANPARSTVWIADREWAAANAATLKKWSAALEKANAFIEKHPDEARAVIGEYTKMPAAVIKSLPLPYYVVALEPKEIDVWIKVLEDLGQLKKPVTGAGLMMVAK